MYLCSRQMLWVDLACQSLQLAAVTRLPVVMGHGSWEMRQLNNHCNPVTLPNQASLCMETYCAIHTPDYMPCLGLMQDAIQSIL